jgi:hypothetical protein
MAGTVEGPGAVMMSEAERLKRYFLPHPEHR